MLYQDRFSPFALFVLITAAWGGLLFGYHTAVISGVLDTLKNTFHLSLWDEGFIVSIVLLGGLVGALFAGILADLGGRKKVLITTAVIFCLSSFLLGLAYSYSFFLLGRFVSGLAVGLTSVVTPMYLAEIAPPHYRGRFVSLFQLMLAIGILLAYTANMTFAEREGWRFIFLISVIPSFFQLVALFFIPETPSWLLRHKENREAVEALDHLREDTSWKRELPKMKKSASSQYTKVLSSLWTPKVRNIVFIGLLLSIFQQITGVNTIIYYAPKIFNLAGTPSAEIALKVTFSIGVVNTIATFISLWLLDRLGRRLLLIIGTSGMFIFQILLILSLAFTGDQYLSIIGVLGFVFCFAISLGPITWVLLSEIFPLKIRGKAMGLSIFANWLANYVVSLTFLILLDSLSPTGAFSLYALITLAALIFICFFIPETKGKSLEEIEALLVKGKLENQP